MILVEKGTQGFEATDLEKMGMHSSPTCQVSFNGAKVSQENLLGEEGQGFYYAVEFLNEARVETATMGLGISQGALDRAVTYAKSREAYGRKISELQAISHRLAEMATKVEAIRTMIYKAAWGVDRGKADPKLCSMAKWYSARMACEVRMRPSISWEGTAICWKTRWSVSTGCQEHRTGGGNAGHS
jgi:alkylation response protein AidB-like acyl-CoA dehydrogenase